jgi:hypothetical protein
MAWQDELNSLDKELAAGRIKPDEYRRRRDELLASASSNPVGMRRIHRQQPSSIANAFNGEGKPDTSADVTQQVDVPETAWEAKPPGVRPDTPPVRDFVQIAPKQGAEVFGLAVSGPTTARRWPRFLIAIVVLALVAGATWWFAFPTKSSQSVATPPAGEQRTSQFGVESLPNPTDVPLSYSGALTVDQMQIYNLVTPEEAAFLVEAGTGQVYYRGVTAGNLVYHIYAYRTKDQASSRALMSKIVDRNKRIGMTDLAISGIAPSVKAQQVFNETTGIYEAIYVSDQATVRMVVAQSGPHDDAKLAGAMKRVADAVTRSITPN